MNPKNLYLINLVLVFIYKIVAIIIGYCTIKLGYRLIKNGFKGKFKFNAQYKGFKADLYSASPGLLFVLLGSALIVFSIVTKYPLTYKEKSIPTNSTELIIDMPIDTLKDK
jgi:NhaP-type Na+/H+ or K+/H+ antiporter